MKKHILLIIFFVAILGSCAKKEMPTDSRYETNTETKNQKDVSEEAILNKVRDAIKKDDYRMGYLYMQDFEERYMTNRSSINERRLDPRSFQTKGEIINLAEKATKEGRYDRAFLLYRVLLPK